MNPNENKDESPIKMAIRLMITYVIIFLICCAISLIAIAFFDFIMNIKDVIAGENMTSLIIVAMFLFAIRLISWMLSIKISFKGRYVNSLLLKRTLKYISIFIVVFSLLFLMQGYNNNITPNEKHISQLQSQMNLLENNDKGNDQRVIYENEITLVQNRINYNKLVYIANLGVSVIMIPIIWLGMVEVDKKQNRNY